jgi:hypothetical protein
MVRDLVGIKAADLHIHAFIVRSRSRRPQLPDSTLARELA